MYLLGRKKSHLFYLLYRKTPLFRYMGITNVKKIALLTEPSDGKL